MDKKVIFWSFFITLVIMCTVQKTYAVFFSKTNASTTMNIGSFNIKVNDNDLETSKSVSIDDITWTNSNTADNKVSPGSVGEFIIEIDPSESDVSLKYDISIVDHTVKEEKLLTVKDVSVLGGNIYKEEDLKYSGVILLNNISSEKVIVKITVEWVNDEDNNESDSLIGMGLEEPEYIDFTIKFSQYHGETIGE